MLPNMFITYSLDLNDSKQDHYYNSSIYYHKTSHEQVTIHHNNEVKGINFLGN
jgi:hypothetical protein